MTPVLTVAGERYLKPLSLVTAAIVLCALTPEPDDVSGWTFVRSLPVGASLHGVATAHRPLPVRSGETSLRFTLRPGDCSAGKHGWNDCANDRERVELKQSDVQHHGETWWYGFSLFVPGDHRNIWPAKLAFAQFHQEGGKPVVMLQNDKGGLWLDIHDDTGTTRLTRMIGAQAFRGRWHDIRLHIAWSRHSDGFVVAYVGDKVVARYTGKTMTAEQVYFKFGLYRSHVSRNARARETGHVAYFDNIVRSRTALPAPD